MENFEALIMHLLNGDTPKQKYEHLLVTLRTIENVAMPRRGSIEEGWDIEQLTEHINHLGLRSSVIEHHSNYKF